MLDWAVRFFSANIQFQQDFYITYDGLRYEMLGILELFHYQYKTNFDTRTKARITNSPPIFYDRVLGTLFVKF